MQEFTALRAKAKDKRDKIIASARSQIARARSEYNATVASIAELESNLLGHPHSYSKTTSACILEVIPRDRQFSTPDVMAELQALDPDRRWSKDWIDINLNRLRKRGLIRRLKKNSNEPSVYCHVDAPIPITRFEDMRLRDVVVELFGNRAMTLTELTVTVAESSYETKLTRKKLRDKLREILAKDGRLKLEGDKWSVVRSDPAKQS